jgi:DNA/RNA endonuclease YhcR with UshA esterase domain
MIQKKYLFLILALIGILLLLILSQNLEPSQIQISNISENLINQQVKLQANIINIIDFKDKNFQILTLGDETGNITAISNYPSNSNSSLSSIINKTQQYIITGKVQQYKNPKTNLTEPQININTIEKSR